MKSTYLALALSLFVVLASLAQPTHPVLSAEKKAQLTIETLMKWYVDSTGLWNTTSWWNAANAVTALIDYSRLTGSTDYLDVIDNTFEKCKEFEVIMPDPQDNWTCNNFINDYYDDEGWWILAWIAAYDLTGDSKYLDMAKCTFADMASGWDVVCGGGIYWKKPNVAKSAVQNELFMLCSIRIHQRAQGTVNGFSYLEWAHRTWKWFESTGMINENFQVENGLNQQTCQVNTGRRYTYNQGVILSALLELGLVTKKPELIELAHKIAQAAIQYSVHENGILKEPNEPNLNGDATQFKGIFMRHLAFLHAHFPNPVYEEFILKNSQNIWQKARNFGNNEIGALWNGPFDQGDASRQSAALDAFNAAISLTSNKHK